VQASGVRMRADPDPNSELVATLPAGAVTLLVDGPEEAAGMAWYRVAHVEDEGWVASGEDGSWLAQVTNGRIAYGCTGCGDGESRATVTSATDGGGIQGLLDVLGRPSWSPDGSRVAVELEATSEPGSSIVLLSPDGGRSTPLGSGHSVAWTPDGERLAFVEPDGTIVVTDGVDERTGFEVVDHGGVSSLAWSPDGTRLAFTAIDCPDCPIGEPIYGDPPISVFAFEPPGGAVLKLATGGNSGSVRWTPDGSALTFLELDLGTGELALRRVPATGGESTVLAGGELVGYGHDFSPDGSRIVAGSTNGIVIADLDGANRQLIVPGGVEMNPMPQSPRWSPDGEWILYDRAWTTGDAIETWVVRIDGTDDHQLTDDGYHADWRPVLHDLPAP
jgi:Tol biopolymer transport system component